jgi:protein SCO1/2
MTTPTPAPGSGPKDRRAAIAAMAVVLLFGLLGAGLVVLVALAPAGAAQAVPEASSYQVADIDAAPALSLTDQDGAPFTLGQPGRPTLVFFGYTHCPDVCPETVGVITQAVTQAGPGPRALFVSIDPERDDVVAMKAYVNYLPDWFTGLTGTVGEIRENADRWGVRYAKVDAEPGETGYGMAHTADVFLVDAAGRLRARFPFGTPAESIAGFLRTLLSETPVAAVPPRATPGPSAAATPAATATPAPSSSAPPAATVPPGTAAPPPATAAALLPELISSSVWAREHAPVILRATDASGAQVDAATPVSVQLTRFDGTPVGSPVVATTVLPEGETRPYFVADLDIPDPGAWKLQVTAGAAQGEIPVQALDPGSTTPIGGPAPDIDTPTLDDVGGVVRAVTTEPDPDLRLSTTSTADARAAGKPYVIVIDSSRFRVSPACGRALAMIEVLVDRWPNVDFIHLEPFRYQVITEEPVLDGPITNPPLNRWAAAWGLGDATWPATDMPWIFVVDGQGIVRAKATGIIGTADVDVILSQLLGAPGRAS